MNRLILLFILMVANIQYLPAIYDAFENNPEARFYIIAGGRGKGATWGIGNEIITRCLEQEHFALCSREIKDTIDTSSRRTIETLIKRANLQAYFDMKASYTICKRTKSENEP